MIRVLEDKWRATPALDDESSKMMFPEFKALQTKFFASCSKRRHISDIPDTTKHRRLCKKTVRFHSCDTLVPPAHISIASLRAWSTR
jgi:hypothetical protein